MGHLKIVFLKDICMHDVSIQVRQVRSVTPPMFLIFVLYCNIYLAVWYVLHGEEDA